MTPLKHALVGLALLSVLSTPANADETMIEACLKAAAELHHVSAGVLALLLNVEGGRLRDVSANPNGTVDIGPMQVNDAWVPKVAAHWRASPDATYRALRDNFCANVEGGAWILKQALDDDEVRNEIVQMVVGIPGDRGVHEIGRPVRPVLDGERWPRGVMGERHPGDLAALGAFLPRMPFPGDAEILRCVAERIIARGMDGVADQLALGLGRLELDCKQN